MSKEKKIEEMAKVIDEFTEPLSARDIHKADFSERFAEHLYNAGYSKQEWISVEERVPDNGEAVLTVDNEGYMIVASWYELGGWFLPVCRANPVTHWMLLPEAPKMKGGAE